MNIVRINDAKNVGYKHRKSEKISTIRMRMYKGRTVENDLWNLVRMYDDTKQRGWTTYDGKTSENETLNKVRMLDTNWEKLEEDETLKTVRMYDAHNGNSEQKRLNIVRMPDVQINGENYPKKKKFQ